MMFFFFQIPNYSQKVHNGSNNASCCKANEAIFVIVGMNTIWLFQFVICSINDNKFFRFKTFFDRFLKYLCFLFIMIGGLINC